MKLRNIFTILVISLFILTASVSGYSAETFSIVVGENYEQTEEDGIVMFQNPETGDNIVVQEIEQKIIGGKLTTYQLNSITNEIVNQYKDLFDAEVEQLGKEDVTINGRNVTRLTFKTTLFESAIYQELNIFVATDKIYDIIFTSTTEDGFSDEEKSAVLNSFEIIEDTNYTSEDTNTDTSTNNEYTPVAYDLTNLELAWIEIGIIFIAGVVLTIFAIKRNPKNKLYILAIILLVLQVAAVKGYEIQYGSTKGITEDVAYNIGFFVLAIIGIILLIIQVAKKPKQEQEIKAEKEENKVEQEPVKELEENKDTSQEKEVIEEKKKGSQESREDKE